MPEKVRPTLIGIALCVPVYFHEDIRENHLLIKPKGNQPPIVFELNNEQMMLKLEQMKPPIIEVEYIIGTSKEIQYYQDFIEKYTTYDSSWKEKLEKYEQIYKYLVEAGIKLVGREGPNPILEDETCGWKVTQSIAFWETHSVAEIVESIIVQRDEHKQKKENNVNEN